MSTAVTFSDLENASKTDYDKPFFKIAQANDEDQIFTWLKQELEKLQKDNERRFETARNNYLRYKGHQYHAQVYQQRDVLEGQQDYSPQMVLPMVSDVIDEKVARLMEIKPFVAVIPKNDESKDKQDAKVAKMFLSHIDQEQQLDTKFTETLKMSKIDGEAFHWVIWNPDLGESVVDENMMAQAGIQHAPNIGDVEVIKKGCKFVLYPKAQSWQKVDYCFVIDFDYTEGIKQDYPHLAEKIHQDDNCKFWNYETMEEMDMAGMSRKIHFYHKKTKRLPQGYEACFVSSALLKRGPLTYKHGKLPVVRIVDIQNTEELSGQSSIDKTKSIASTANDILNAVTKMFKLAGYAKWFVEEGATDHDHLTNDVNIVTVKRGAQTPILAQANPVGDKHFLFVDKLREWFYDFSKSNSVVRGEPPAGVDAFVALQFLSESESRRLSTEVQQTNAFVVGTYDLILKTTGQFYKKDEPRTMMIMGKESKWEMQGLDIEALQKPYAVVIQNTSGLSESKALRTQQVLDVEERFQGLIPREQVAEMVGLAQGEKYLDLASRAARAAEDENEKMNEGHTIEPAEWEHHVSHWKIHTQEMQPLGFKEKSGGEILNNYREHIMAHEMFMMDMAMKNPAFTQVLLTLEGFPMFMESPLMPQMTPPEELVKQGIDPLMAQAPAVDPAAMPMMDQSQPIAEDPTAPAQI